MLLFIEQKRLNHFKFTLKHLLSAFSSSHLLCLIVCDVFSPVIIWDMLLPDVTHIILSVEIWIKVGRLYTKQFVPFFRSTTYRMDRACRRHPWCFQRRWLLFWFRPPVSAPSPWRPAVSLVLRPTMLSGEWVIRPWLAGDVKAELHVNRQYCMSLLRKCWS